MRQHILSVVAVATLAASALCADFDKAVMLDRHGLRADAKRELIDLAYDDEAKATEKARALYMLGTIAFDENKLSAAIKTWTELVAKFPDAPESTQASEHMKGLADVLGETTGELVADAEARSYLRHADFWSRRKSDVFVIDSSWLPKVDMAIAWYDKVISEYPGTRAAELAFIGKLRTVLGWVEPGRHGRAKGLANRGVASRAKYDPILLATFAAFQKAHPDAGTLQAFRFQIGQSFWRNARLNQNDRKQALHWLGQIIEHGEDDTFYVDLARRRMSYMGLASGRELKAGVTYKISNGCQRWHEFAPKLTVAAVEKMREVPADGRITVLEIREKFLTPWYRVRAADLEGWVDSGDLTDQAIDEAEAR